MICLFNDGTLNGLQFEMEKPPHRIRVETLSEVLRTIVAAPYSVGQILEPSMETHQRHSETYIRCSVHLSTEGSLPSLDEELQGQIVVYRLERVW